MSAFTRCKTELEHLHGRIALARIDETIGGGGEGGDLIGTVIGIARGHVERVARLLKRRAVKPVPDKFRVANDAGKHNRLAKNTARYR